MKIYQCTQCGAPLKDVTHEIISCEFCRSRYKNPFVTKQFSPAFDQRNQTVLGVQLNTGGGAYIGGTLHLGGGDFVGRDRITKG